MKKKILAGILVLLFCFIISLNSYAKRESSNNDGTKTTSSTAEDKEKSSQLSSVEPPETDEEKEYKSMCQKLTDALEKSKDQNFQNAKDYIDKALGQKHDEEIREYVRKNWSKITDEKLSKENEDKIVEAVRIQVYGKLKTQIYEQWSASVDELIEKIGDTNEEDFFGDWVREQVRRSNRKCC